MIAIGRAAFLYNSVEYLHNKGYKIDAIITDEGYEEYDRHADDFKDLANRIGCRFFKVSSLNIPEIFELIKKNKCDIAISVNWKYKIPKHFISLFKLGMYNLHMGNLPDYKGNATPNWTILNGEKFMYVNIHKITEDFDAGDIIVRKKINIGENDYIGDIISKAVEIAPKLYKEAINKIRKKSTYKLIKGTKEGLRCYPRLPIDSQITWNESAGNIHRLIRASSHPLKEHTLSLIMKKR